MQILLEPFPHQWLATLRLRKMKITAAKPKFQAIIPPEKTEKKSSVKQFFKLQIFFLYLFLPDVSTNGPTLKVVRETSSNSYTTENERISPKMELFQKEMNHLPTIDLQGTFVTRSHLPLNLVPAAWFGICERGFG